MDADKGQVITVPGWLELKITLGNIVAVAFFLVAGGTWYARMDGRVTSAENNLAKSEITYVRQDIAKLREEALAARLDNLTAQLSRIEKKLDEIK